MKKQRFTYIKLAGLIILVIFLFAFTGKRNKQRKINKVLIEFVEEQDPYVNETTVNKLLIQNEGSVTSVGKEILVLNSVEKELDSHKMRVNAITPFYVDVTGNTMPLSNGFSAHVPLIHNVSKREIPEVFPVLKEIWEDEFLRKHVVGVHKNVKAEYELELRVYAFKVVIGKIENLNIKIKNFKAFYQKAFKDKSLKKYKKVSLQFSNQVVCTLN